MENDSPQTCTLESAPTTRVLLIEDNGQVAELVQAMLHNASASRFETTHVSSLQAAHEWLSQPDTRFDAILLDLMLPDAAGLESVKRLQQAAEQTPVVVITCNDDEGVSLQAVQSGVQGYVVKDELSPSLLSRAILHAIERYRIILELEQSQRRERYWATHDPLTRLANRALLLDRLGQAVASAGRSGKDIAVLFLDLDRFKNVNDTLGHGAGDEVLQSVAGELETLIRTSDTAARVGGDEFVVVLTNLAQTVDAAKVAEKIVEKLEHPVTIEGRSLVTTASVGIASYPRDGASPEELLQSADLAMYHAKQRGRNQYAFYSSDLNKAANQRFALENELGAALENNELFLEFQPQVDVQDGKIRGAEALLRWKQPGRGVISPMQFLPLAEETRLIIPIGEWVLRTACQQAKRWHDEGHHDFEIAVNISAMQLDDAGFDAMVRSVLEETGLPPRCLQLEITESALVHQETGSHDGLHALRRLGIQVWVDDFGKGYSSLSYLKSLPLDGLKIDKIFVDGLLTDPADAAITAAIVGVADGLNLGIIAEGVEMEEQMQCLTTYGCRTMQGYFFSKPCSPESFALLLENPPLEKPEEN